MGRVIAVIGHDASSDERKVRRVLRDLPEKHRRALRDYMERRPVERRALESALDAFRAEWSLA